MTWWDRWGASPVTLGPVGRVVWSVVGIAIPVALMAPFVLHLVSASTGGGFDYQGNPFVEVPAGFTGVLMAMLWPRYLGDLLRPHPGYEKGAWQQRSLDQRLGDEIRKSSGADHGIDDRGAPPRW